MAFHDKTFWSVIFFLSGILIASLFSGFDQSFLLAGLCAALLIIGFLIFKRYIFAVLAIFIILGAGFYFLRDRSLADRAASLHEDLYSGTVVRLTNSVSAQLVDVALLEQDIKVRLTLQPFPALKYGDKVSFAGPLTAADLKGKPYLKKDGILATSAFPKNLAITGHAAGSKIISALYALREKVMGSFAKVLPPQEATFMTGLTLGKGGGFPKDFLNKLSLTGTTHLVALSGQNISIIAAGVIFLFGSLFRRRLAIILSVLAILAFVLMTGAEASVVRAAFMAGVVFLAEQSGRIYQVRNSIAFAALIMALVNPYVLVFDVGFQLSFLALLGIIYLKPAIAKLFKISPEPGFLAWRANLLTALAAQLAVLPILLSAFGSFSVLSLIANLLILEFIPLTMGLGFIIFAASTISYYLSLIFGWFARLFLDYELGVINLFAKFPILIEVKSFPLVFGIIYYILLLGMIIYAGKKIKHAN